MFKKDVDPFDNLYTIQKVILKCSKEEVDMSNLRKVFKRLDRNCRIRQIAEKEGFMTKPKVLYKYTSKEHADDLLENGLLYCGTIENYRKGKKEDEKELTLWSIKDIITEENEDVLNMMNEMLEEDGKPAYDPSKIMGDVDSILMKRHISCMSSNPYIEKMWEWCGNEEGICIPIKVKGLPYYKAIYGDEKDDFSDEIEDMFEVLIETFVGKVKKKQVEELCNRVKAATYISICRKTTNWDYQEEYRMFVEDKDLLVIDDKHYFPVKGRVRKPITYQDYLKNKAIGK
ncbi:MAG: hypothetical protein E7Z70_04370 [Thermoplasmata archaeon]|nr:hypothetical protein [Thermoplasmata archaeon]